MSQHDFEIANQGFPSFRSDLNSGLQALASNSAGATEPSTTYAYQMWYDSTANLLKMRNTDNDAWITLAYFDQTNDEWEVRSAVIQAVDSAGVTIKNDGGTTLIEAKDDGSVVFRTDDVTIDSSGNLLVGTTDTPATLISATSGGGIALDPDGYSAFNREATGTTQSIIVLNHTGTDGNFLLFRKDGSSVGSIGIATTGLYIDGEAAHTGLKFRGFDIIPRDGAVDSDDGVNLGGSVNRFKDLYLSGGVYLGGTGAANYLDDYEEGYFDPVYTSTGGGESVTMDPNSKGYYIKVGSLVHFQLNAKTDSISGGSGNALLSGLPFAGANLTGDSDYVAFALGFVANFGGDYPTRALLDRGTSNILLFYQTSYTTNSASIAWSDMSSGSDVNNVYISGTYYTAS